MAAGGVMVVYLSHLSVAERREGGGGFRDILEEGIETPEKGIRTQPKGQHWLSLTSGEAAALHSGQSVLVVWKDKRM